jgi:hypothetical protein
MEVSGQFHTPAILPREGFPDAYWIGSWVGPSSGLDAVAKKKNPYPWRELNRSRTACNLVTILTELPRLLTVSIRNVKRIMVKDHNYV